VRGSGSREGNAIGISAQNLDWRKEGAFTGKSAGCLRMQLQYVIIGHSERRQFLRKRIPAWRRRRRPPWTPADPIVCVGELLADREEGRTEAVLLSNYRWPGSLTATNSPYLLAYEPVWPLARQGATPESRRQPSVLARCVADQFSGNTPRLCGFSMAAASSLKIFRSASAGRVGRRSWRSDLSRKVRADRELP